MSVFEGEHVVHGATGAVGVHRDNAIGNAGRANDGEARQRAVRVILARHVVRPHIGAVIKVQVRKQHRVYAPEVGVSRQRAQRSVTKIKHEPIPLVLNEIAGGGRFGVGIRARAPHDGQTH